MILVDTWAWVALGIKKDQHHRAAAATHQRLQKSHRRYVTTDFIFNEVINAVYARQSADRARAYIAGIWAKADTGALDLVHVSPAQFRRAWQLRQKYDDKPGISFVDFTSMAVNLPPNPATDLRFKPGH